MLRAFVTAVVFSIATMGIAQAHSDKPKDAAEKKAAHGKHASKGDAKKDHEREKHGSDHGKSERKH